MKILALTVLGAFAAFAAGSSEVIVKVTGIRNDQGRVVVSVYNTKSGFLRDFSQATRTVAVPVINGTASASFTNLESGTYAVAVVHDENGNGRFDTAKEGFGTSGQGKAFEDAKFHINGNPKNVEIQLSYK